jgi:integrase
MSMGAEWIGNGWGLVWTTRSGRPLRGTNVLRTFRHLLRMARITTPYRLHDLRASYATGLIAANVDIRTAGALLGHSSPTLTLRVYAAAVPALRREAALRVSDLVLAPGNRSTARSLAVSSAVRSPDAAPLMASTTLD